MIHSCGHEDNSDHDGWIAILVCDNMPNQKFWDGNDWTSDIGEAIVYPKYGDVFGTIHKEIPEEKVTHRITSVPKCVYLRILREGK